MTTKKKIVKPKGKSGLESPQIEINPEVKKPPVGGNTMDENIVVRLIREKYIKSTDYK